MNTRKLIFVDGVKTREEIDKVAGKPEGITKLCEEKGVSNGTINKICRDGYGTPESIQKYQAAGFPICLSTRPVPCRKRKEHTRNDDRGERKEKTQILPFLPLPDPEEPRQMTIKEITEATEIKELLISHLTALIEDLKKI